MQYLLSGVYLLIFFLFSFGCTTGGQENSEEKTSTGTSLKQADEVIVYGNHTCPHCVAFTNKLKDNGIKYIFKEVDKRDENFKEMYEKVQSAEYQGYIQYPVVDINGKILVSPEYDEFRKHLR